MTTSTHFIRSLFLFAILVSFISGCAATGPSYTSLKSTISQLKSDNARIYFLREGSFVNYEFTARVHLNGIKVVGLNNNGFAYVDRPAGNVLIMVAATCSISQFGLAAAYWDLLIGFWCTDDPLRKDAPLNFGEARKMFTVENGKTYYFLVANDSSNVMAGLIGGAIGAASEGGGRFAFYQIPEAMALEQLKTKKLSGKPAQDRRRGAHEGDAEGPRPVSQHHKGRN